MGNKKLLVINVLTLFAFIAVVGAGISQSDSGIDEYGELFAVNHKTMENVVEEREKILLSEDDIDEIISALSIERKVTIGAMILQNKEWLLAETKEIEETPAEEMESVNENVVAAEESISWQENNESSGTGTSWNDNNNRSENSATGSGNNDSSRSSSNESDREKEMDKDQHGKAENDSGKSKDEGEKDNNSEDNDSDREEDENEENENEEADDEPIEDRPGQDDD
jgi:hypothetical protein